MRISKVAAALSSFALAFDATGAAAFGGFIDEDEIVINFEGSKPGKLENIRWDLNDVRLSADEVLHAKSRALIMAAGGPNAFGVGRLPFLGAGAFSVVMTLGFLTSLGLTTNSLVAMEIDIPFDSNPLLFYVLAMRPLGDDLQVSVRNQAGPVGAPVTLTNTRLARLRIKQTDTEMIFDARNVRGGPWVNVATIANPVTSLIFQLSFGAALLNAGAVAMFDDLHASGSIFSPTEVLYLATLYGLLADLATARAAIIHETNRTLALATILAFETALLATMAGIQTDFFTGQFLPFTQVALALRHLNAANREAGKVEKPLDRGLYTDALERIVRIEAFVQLATLALRGMRARKLDELGFFLGGKGHWSSAL